MFVDWHQMLMYPILLKRKTMNTKQILNHTIIMDDFNTLLSSKYWLSRKKSTEIHPWDYAVIKSSFKANPRMGQIYRWITHDSALTPMALSVPE